MTPDEIAQIDAQLQVWRQGDVVLIDAWPSIHLAHLAAPGTPESEALAAELTDDGDRSDLAVITVDTPGFMVISQSCDIVRTCADRPFVEVCPLQAAPPDKLPLVRLGRMPRYVWVSGLRDDELAADLERVTSLEKATLVRFAAERRAGVATESEARVLGEALGRKRSRAAFPDDFITLVTPLQKRIIERHNRDSEEGQFLRAVEEIRIIAAPGWAADAVAIELLFLFASAGAIPAKAEERVEDLIRRAPAAGRFTSVDGRALALDALSAAAYLASYRLDLEHLSAPGP